MLEIEVARLEYAHYLKANGGLSVERDGGGADELLDELEQDVADGLHLAALDDGAEAVEQGVHAEQRLVLHLVGFVLGTLANGHALDELLEPDDELEVRGGGLAEVVRTDEAEVRVAADMPPHVVGGTGGRLVLRHLNDERGHECVGERIAGGDVHTLHLVGQTMDDGRQQMLVAKDDGRLASVGNAVALLQPVAHIACLNVLGRSADEGELLAGIGEIAEDVGIAFVELVGKHLPELAEIVSGFVRGLHIVGVEVPIETGLALLLELAAERGFHLLHHVEAHEEIEVVVEVGVVSFGNVAIEHAFVGNLLFAQALAELVVDVVEVRPEVQEALFQA